MASRSLVADGERIVCAAVKVIAKEEVSVTEIAKVMRLDKAATSASSREPSESSTASPNLSTSTTAPPTGSNRFGGLRGQFPVPHTVEHAFYCGDNLRGRRGKPVLIGVADRVGGMPRH